MIHTAVTKLNLSLTKSEFVHDHRVDMFFKHDYKDLIHIPKHVSILPCFLPSNLSTSERTDYTIWIFTIVGFKHTICMQIEMIHTHLCPYTHTSIHKMIIWFNIFSSRKTQHERYHIRYKYLHPKSMYIHGEEEKRSGNVQKLCRKSSVGAKQKMCATENWFTQTKPKNSLHATP